MSIRILVVVVLIGGALACSRESTAPSAASDHVSFAVQPAPRYKLRFVAGVNPSGDGELRSGWFPDTGVVLNARAPWKSLNIAGATIELVNYTYGSWAAGTCATFKTSATTNYTNWEIAGTEPPLSFAGTWYGTVSTSQLSGTNLYFDGDRVVDGILSPSAGGIHNLASNNNQAYESKDPTGNNDWFQLELRNAAMKFGSASSADGVTNPTGPEVACANFTLLAKKASLVGQ